MPKTAFYNHLKLKPQEKKHFVSQIERVTLANCIKSSTMNIDDGEKYHEILIVLFDLKSKEIDSSLLVSIASQNHHPLVFVCRYLKEERVYLYRQRLYGTEWVLSDSTIFNTEARSIDNLWDGLCAHVALGEHEWTTSENLDARLEMNQKVFNLEEEKSRLLERSRKEKQPAKKNMLFEQAQLKQQELKQLKAGL